ncbi:MAG TPA: hypothetical protein VFZ80_06035 [Acidimicrobiia bacterium]
MGVGYGELAMTMTRPSMFSERRGFTIVGGQPSTVGPIVTRLSGSRSSFVAMRVAAGHAMTRSCGMIILDETGDMGFPFDDDAVDERERSVAEGILANDHVSRVPIGETGLREAILRGIEAEASLLVLGPEDILELTDTPALMTALIDAPFDVLLLASTGTDRLR